MMRLTVMQRPLIKPNIGQLFFYILPVAQLNF